jgi:hypothetical protein
VISPFSHLLSITLSPLTPLHPYSDLEAQPNSSFSALPLQFPTIDSRFPPPSVSVGTVISINGNANAALHQLEERVLCMLGKKSAHQNLVKPYEMIVALLLLPLTLALGGDTRI